MCVRERDELSSETTPPGDEIELLKKGREWKGKGEELEIESQRFFERVTASAELVDLLDYRQHIGLQP